MEDWTNLKLDRRELLQAGALAVGGSVLAACGFSPQTSTDNSVSDITIMEAGKAVSYAATYIALSGGYFTRQRLKVDYQTSSNGSTAAIAAVVGGSALLSYPSIPTALAAIDKGAPVRIVGLNSVVYGSELALSNSWMTKTNITTSSSTTDKLAALKGAKIAVYTAGDSGEQFIRFMFKTYMPSFNPSTDMQIIPLQTIGNIVAAAQRGAVDGVCLSSPGPEQVQGQNLGQIILKGSMEPKLKGYPFGVIVANVSDIQSKSDLITRALTAIFQACTDLRKTPDNYKSLVQQQLPGVTADVFALSYGPMLEGLPTSMVLSKDQFAVYTQVQEVLGTPTTLTYDKAVDTKAASQVKVTA